ncbi:hypothetical protein [Calothrix sp. NIES-3974]|uniref:hypothetical protein n=1 Tax=Calothrix sp. NIES-3974 TaxID=2005462 RepID=UPI000BBC6811|nr:hypothetical protein [Calothrix sp. NIES-3974]
MKDFLAKNAYWIRVSRLGNQKEVRTILENLTMNGFERFFSAFPLTSQWLKEYFKGGSHLSTLKIRYTNDSSSGRYNFK